MNIRRAVNRMAKANTAKKEAKTEVEPPKKVLSNKEFARMMNTRLGEGTIYSLTGGAEDRVKIQPVSTGIPSLDYSLGIGGLPWGRVVELYGAESSGKTTLALHVVKTFQEMAKRPNHPFYGKKTMFMDMEHALDPLHAQALGVDISEEGMFVTQPDTAEEAYDAMFAYIQSGEVGVIVLDSLASMIPKKILDGSAEDNTIALAARLNSVNIPKVAQMASKHNCLVIFINQIRVNVGQMFGNPETTPGGKALRFFSSVRMEIRRKEIKKGDVFLGQTIFANIKKNKVSRPFTKAEFDYYWDTGIDIIKDIMNTSFEMDIIKRAGAWYYLGDSSKEPWTDGNGNELKWNGKDAVEATLKISPALFNYINDIVQGSIPRETQFIQETDDDELEKEMKLESEKEEQEA